MRKRKIIGQINMPVRQEDMRIALFDLIVNQQIDPATLKSYKALEHALEMLREHTKDFFKQRWELEKDHFEEHVGIYSWECHVETVTECFERLFNERTKSSI